MRRCSWAVGLAVLALAVVLVLAVVLGLAVLAAGRAGRVSRSGWTSRCFERRVTAVSFPRKNRIVAMSYVFYSRAAIVRFVCFALTARSFVAPWSERALILRLVVLVFVFGSVLVLL